MEVRCGLQEKPKLVFVGAGHLKGVTILQGEKVLPVDMRLHFLDLVDIDNGRLSQGLTGKYIGCITCRSMYGVLQHARMERLVKMILSFKVDMSIKEQSILMGL